MSQFDDYGDYAVDHGHADNEAYQSGGYTGWLDAVPAQEPETAPASLAELLTVTADDYLDDAGNPFTRDARGHDDRGTFGFTSRADARYAEKPAVTWCPVHEENVNRYSHDWTGH
jgi:hypothetical protein